MAPVRDGASIEPQAHAKMESSIRRILASRRKRMRKPGDMKVLAKRICSGERGRSLSHSSLLNNNSSDSSAVSVESVTVARAAISAGSGEPQDGARSMSYSRSKIGCVTCRLRRVKCDEDKPFCQRCVRSRRQCGGYQVSRALIFDPDISRQDRRSLQFLRECSRSLLEVHTEDDFVMWNQLMLQASHRHEAIRYGVLSLSAYCESLSNPHEVQANAAQARRHYSDALSAAASSAALQYSASTDEVLLLSLLLHCLELFRQQYANAYVHLQAALNIVKDMSPSEFSRSQLARVVQRLEKRPNFKIDSLSLARAASEPPGTVDDARKRLMLIQSWMCIRLYKSRDGHEDLQSVCQAFQLQLLEFRTDLDEFCRTRRFKTGIEARNAIYIRIMHGLAALAVSMVSAAEAGSEGFLRTSSDKDIRELLECCKAFADAGLDETSTARPIHFGFDTELILIVVFLACSTNDHTLRKDAMSFLQSAHRQEGSWDSFHAAHIIECFDCPDSQARAVISTVEYFYDRSTSIRNPQSREFTRPDTVCVQIGDPDSSTHSALWFRCTCNCLKLCGSKKSSDSPIDMSCDTAHWASILIPAYEQIEFTPSIVTQILISAGYRQGLMPTHLGSSAIAVRQKTAAAFRTP